MKFLSIRSFAPDQSLRLCRWLVAVAVLGFAPALEAQSASPAASGQASPYSQQNLQDMLEPIALYPDALIALILPAATMPTDIILAARFLREGGREEQIDSQPWDDSVKSLARYPGVIQWMDENLEWTASLGDAFVAQPADVMNTMQGLRQKARLAGHLKDTPQQTVVEEVVEKTTYIRIVPTEPNIIYVPSYDPAVVYYASRPLFVGPVISFGVGFAIGSWLNYDCDWGRRGIYRGAYRSDWHRNWNRPGKRFGGSTRILQNTTNVNVVNITSQSAQRWTPPARAQHRVQRRSAIRQNRGARTTIRQPQRMANRTSPRGNALRKGKASPPARTNRFGNGFRNQTAARRATADNPADTASSRVRRPAIRQNQAPRVTAADRMKNSSARTRHRIARTRTAAPSLNTPTRNRRPTVSTSAPRKSSQQARRQSPARSADRNPAGQRFRTAPTRTFAPPTRTSRPPTARPRPQAQNRTKSSHAHPASARPRTVRSPMNNRAPESRPRANPSRNAHQKKSPSPQRPQFQSPRKQGRDAARPRMKQSQSRPAPPAGARPGHAQRLRDSANRRQATP